MSFPIFNTEKRVDFFQVSRGFKKDFISGSAINYSPILDAVWTKNSLNQCRLITFYKRWPFV